MCSAYLHTHTDTCAFPACGYKEVSPPPTAPHPRGFHRYPPVPSLLANTSRHLSPTLTPAPQPVAIVNAPRAKARQPPTPEAGLSRAQLWGLMIVTLITVIFSPESFASASSPQPCTQAWKGSSGQSPGDPLGGPEAQGSKTVLC